MARKRQSLIETFIELRNDFRMAEDTRFVSRLKGVSPMGSGADYHYRVEQRWLHMLERARHYQRNDQVVGQGIRRVVANIVQDGFKLDPQSGSDEADDIIKYGWEDWATDPDQCHSEGELTFNEQERVALSTVIADGDTFCLPLKVEGSLQWVEAHRCRKPTGTRQNVVHGVLMDDHAKRLEYWFTKENLNPYQPLSLVSDIKKYPARDADGFRQVLHLYMPDRFSQRRGITCLAPCSDTVGMHDDVQFATLVKAQAAALVTILHNRGPNWEPLVDGQKGPRTQDTVGGFTRTIEGYSAGLEVFSDPDEKLEAFSPNIPSPEFFPHTMMLLTFIAINLDIPVHVLLLDPSRTNFSGWRGAIDQARLRFKQVQGWMVAKFHSPVFRWWIRRQLITNKRLAELAKDPRVNVFGHRWNPPQFPYIEPLVDATADDLQATRFLNSRRRLQAARGREFDEIRDESLDDNASMITGAIERANALNQKFPEAKVNWREVISVPMADKATATLPLIGESDGGTKKEPGPGGKNNPDVQPDDGSDE